MKFQYQILFVVTGFFVFVGSAVAQNSLGENREAIKEKREEIQQVRQETRANIKVRWEEIRDKREATREAVRNMRVEKREAVKAKIVGIRDERKKQVVERIQTNLTQINANRTDHFLKILERLSAVLDKIQSRLEKAKTAGKDTSSIDSVLSLARSAISNAEAVVNTQKEKTYQITVNDDTTARNDAGLTAKQLQEDLASVRVQVQTASSAVKNVFDQFKAIRGIDEVSTSSGTPVE